MTESLSQLSRLAVESFAIRAWPRSASAMAVVASLVTMALLFPAARLLSRHFEYRVKVAR
jgi:hypothetical protein